MNNTQLFPFERNRYYAGKMLSSSDFGAEQIYMNNKRRFLNNMLFGSGIVCGLSVYNLDDLSVFLESGCAIDGLGREIIVDTSVVKKLSAVEGFDQVTGNCLTLCLRYQEEEVHPVYSVKRQSADAEYEFNRIKEGYELFLMDTNEIVKYQLDSEFLAKEIIYQDRNYLLELQMPATVCKERYVKIQVVAKKLSDSGEAFSYNGVLQMPTFLTDDGKHELLLSLDNLSLKEGETVTKEYWVFVPGVALEETTLVVKSLGEGYGDTGTSIKILLDDILPDALVNREIGKVSLEMQSLNNMTDYICLADITLVRTDSAYIIEHITERNVKKYIESPAQGTERRSYLDYFRTGEMRFGQKEEQIPEHGSLVPNHYEDNRIRVATGIVEIPVGGRAKANKVLYSGEIMHGLGPGVVHVQIGQEFIEEDAVYGANVKSTIFGNPDLFEKNAGKNYKATTAVKVLNDKGSFIIAARFEEDTECLILSYRWVAIKYSGNGVQENAEGTDSQWIEVETPTAVLGTKEEFYFGVRFHNMGKCSVAYEVSGQDGGSVSPDGVYTAPNKEGVYEIKIYCAEQPQICTYAYAVVKKK